MNLETTANAILLVLALAVWLLWRLYREASQVRQALASLQIILQHQLTSQYPVFDAQQISFANQENRRLKADAMSEPDDRDHAEEIWVLAQAERAEQLHDFMIQSNLAVINGTKTVQQVRTEWSELYFGCEWMTNAFNAQKAWRGAAHQETGPAV